MNTDQKLNKLDDFLHTISSETTTRLGGEAGYYVFSYDPKDEMKVRHWTAREVEMLQENHRPVVEFDLYKIMTTLLVDKHPRKKYEGLEMRYGIKPRLRCKNCLRSASGCTDAKLRPARRSSRLTSRN